MEFIEPGLSAPLSPDSLQLGMRGFGADLRRAAAETVALAGLRAGDIGSVILVGGSSLMRLVTDMARDLFPAATLQRSQVFTAVVDGLALATERECWTGARRREAWERSIVDRAIAEASIDCRRDNAPLRTTRLLYGGLETKVGRSQRSRC